jgi:SHS2 domain-containing protein
VTAGGRRSPGRGHQVLPHTADVGVQARGPDLVAVFEEAGLALADLAGERRDAPSGAASASPDGPTTSRTVLLRARDVVALAFGWLNELVAAIDVDGALVGVTVTRIESTPAGAWELEATVATAAFDGVRIVRRADVKSATYHGLAVEPDGAFGWTLTAYLDV